MHSMYKCIEEQTFQHKEAQLTGLANSHCHMIIKYALIIWEGNVCFAWLLILKLFYVAYEMFARKKIQTEKN